VNQKARRLSVICKAACFEPLEQRQLFSGSAPVAVDDVVTVAASGTVSGNVLTNDRDAQSDPLAATLMIGVARGRLTFNANGSFTYTAMPGFAGVDQFSYICNDGTSNSKVAYCAIQVGNIPYSSSISGTVFGDANGDGSFEHGEGALSGRTVYIDTNNDGALDNGEVSTTSNALGQYKFSNLPAGPYRVAEVVPAGNVQTAPGKGAEWVVVLGNTQNITGRDFGIYKPSTLSGTVFNDLNRDGVWENGEPLLSGWRIFIDTNNDGRLDGSELSTRSDSNGNFSLSNLPAGNYTLRETMVGGWQATTPPWSTVKLKLGATTTTPFGDLAAATTLRVASTPPVLLFGSNISVSLMNAFLGEPRQILD
jgi:hypothetical protein